MANNDKIKNKVCLIVIDDHLFALIKAIKAHQVPELYIQFYGDGRDTSPNSGLGFLKDTLKFLDEQQYGELATIVGRYYAMDRDKRWERIAVAYEGMVGGKGEETSKEKVTSVVEARYAANETDEFLKPIIVNGDKGRVKDGDTLIFFDYRADRMREISEVMGMEAYKNCNSSLPHPKDLQVYGMTQYKAEFPFPALFPPNSNKNVLAEWLATQGVSQFHCAETEKYAHVTFFFNGGREAHFEGEERCMVPSPKVPTYDHMPEMSSAGVADKMVEQVEAGKHPFLMCNFAPPDMVGHTGEYEAAVKACEATDIAIGRIFDACQKHGYVCMVTADHGNAEKMIAPDGGKHTAHTCYRVPFTNSSDKFKFLSKLDNREMALCDVAPTVLYIMGLPIPPDMSGVSLVEGPQ
ncbi:unnamed protein product, partial [Mesorhabditis spiculigera]